MVTTEGKNVTKRIIFFQLIKDQHVKKQPSGGYTLGLSMYYYS